MLKRSVIEYVDDFFHLRITVRQATLREGLRRTALIARQGIRAEEELAKMEEAFDAEKYAEDRALLWMHPSCIAGTESIENLDPEKREQLSLEALAADVQSFFELPDALMVIWEDAVIRLNPQWSPFFEPGVAGTPKSSESGSKTNSSNGTSKETDGKTKTPTNGAPPS